MSPISALDRSYSHAAAPQRNSEVNISEIPVPTLMAPDCKETPTGDTVSEASRLKNKAYATEFIKHLVRFSISGAFFGLAVAASVLSGGLAIPAAAVAGTAMVIAAGDAACALYNLIQVRNDREPLAFCDNCIVLTVRKLMEFCGCSARTSERIADAASVTIRVGVACATLLLPVLSPNTGLVDTAVQVLSLISLTAINVRTTAETIIGAVSDRIETQRSKLNTTVNTADVGVQTEKHDDETTEQWAAKLNDFFLNYMPQP